MFEQPEYFEKNIKYEMSFQNLSVINDYKRLFIFLVAAIGFVLWGDFYTP